MKKKKKEDLFFTIMSATYFLPDNLGVESVSSQRNGSFDNMECQNSLPSSSTKNITKQIFDETFDENHSEDSESKQLAIIPSDIIESKLRHFVSGEIDKDTCQILTHHCSYKLGEIIKSAMNYMTNCGRLKFTVEDFNKGLVLCGENPIMTYDILPTPCDENPILPTAKKKRRQKPKNKKIQSIRPKTHCVYIKEIWLNNISPLFVSINDLSDELQNYFKAVTKILLLDDKEMNCIILNDLKTNKNIFQLVPYLVNFLCDAINKFKCNFLKISLLLKLLNALLRNPYIYFGQCSYLNTMACTLLMFLVSNLPNFDQGKDSWLLKDIAANILSFILKRSKDQHLFFEIIYLVQSVLTFENPLNSHYGGLVALNSIGITAVVLLLPSYIPKFHEYVKMIPSSCNQNGIDVHMVQGQIIRSYYILVDYCFNNEFKKPKFISAHTFNSKAILSDYLKDIQVFPILSQLALSDYFGEALLPAFPSLNFVSHSTYLMEKKKQRKKSEGKKNIL